MNQDSRQQEAIETEHASPDLSESGQGAGNDQNKAAKVARKGGMVVGLVILGSLLWFLLADRFTPYTSQARVQGYVIGVAPKVAGLITQVWVSNNQQVDAGERLFEIDPSQYLIALESARSQLDNARNQVGAGDAAVEAARASLRAAMANETKAMQDATRLTRLHEQDPGTVSVRRLEIARATLDQARAQVTAAEADIQRAIEQKGGDDNTNNSIIKSAQSALEKAELDLDNTVVTASSPGVITDLRTDVGLYAGTGSPVMTLVALNDVWVSAEFTENNLGNLTVGAPVEVAYDALPGRVFHGEVRSIGLGVSAGQAPPPGSLPTIDNSRDWLRPSQRFPVVIDLKLAEQPELVEQLRVGGQATVIAYTEGHYLLGLLGRLYIRIASLLSYAY